MAGETYWRCKVAAEVILAYVERRVEDVEEVL